MNLLSIELFCLVAEHGSVSEAARQAYVSQPAVTRHIQALEAVYGAPLFDRHDQGLKLNTYGHFLYPYLKAIIADHRRALEAFQSFLKSSPEPVKIGATRTIGEYWLPYFLAEAKARFSWFSYAVHIDNTEKIVEALYGHGLDLAFVEGTLDQDDRLLVDIYAVDELLLAARPDHPLTQKTHVHIKDLEGETLIVREEGSGTRKIVQSHLEEKNIWPLLQTLSFDSTQAIKSAVEAGLGISFLSATIVARDTIHNMLKAIPLQDLSIQRPLYLVRPARRLVMPHVKELIDFILDENVVQRILPVVVSASIAPQQRAEDDVHLSVLSMDGLQA